MNSGLYDSISKNNVYLLMLYKLKKKIEKCLFERYLSFFYLS